MSPWASPLALARSADPEPGSTGAPAGNGGPGGLAATQSRLAAVWAEIQLDLDRAAARLPAGAAAGAPGTPPTVSELPDSSGGLEVVVPLRPGVDMQDVLDELMAAMWTGASRMRSKSYSVGDSTVIDVLLTRRSSSITGSTSALLVQMQLMPGASGERNVLRVIKSAGPFDDFELECLARITRAANIIPSGGFHTSVIHRQEPQQHLGPGNGRQQAGRGPGSQQQQEEEVWGSKKAVQAVRQLRSMGAQVFPPGNKEVMDWGVLAGYEDQKRQIEDCLLYPLLRPEVYNRLAEHTRHSFQSNRPRAVLFEGPPGTGKTTSARVISSQASVPLVYVPLESVMSKWFGESEGLLARVFSAANDLGGAIIFIDELDSLGGSRERGDMHEASRRMLSVLLREMDGFDASRRAIVIGATNRKSDLDAALLSRFDLVINFGLPDTNCRRLILARYARHLSPADLEALAGRTAGLAGRDLRDVAEHTERRWASKIIRGEVAESSLPPLGEYVRSAESRLAALQMEGLPGALPLGLPGVIEGMQPSTSL